MVCFTWKGSYRVESADINTLKEITNNLISFIDSEVDFLSAEKLKEIEEIETFLYSFIQKIKVLFKKSKK